MKELKGLLKFLLDENNAQVLKVLQASGFDIDSGDTLFLKYGNDVVCQCNGSNILMNRHKLRNLLNEINRDEQISVELVGKKAGSDQTYHLYKCEKGKVTTNHLKSIDSDTKVQQVYSTNLSNNIEDYLEHFRSDYLRPDRDGYINLLYVLGYIINPFRWWEGLGKLCGQALRLPGKAIQNIRTGIRKTVRPLLCEHKNHREFGADLMRNLSALANIAGPTVVEEGIVFHRDVQDSRLLKQWRNQVLLGSGNWSWRRLFIPGNDALEIFVDYYSNQSVDDRSGAQIALIRDAQSGTILGEIGYNSETNDVRVCWRSLNIVDLDCLSELKKHLEVLSSPQFSRCVEAIYQNQQRSSRELAPGQGLLPAKGSDVTESDSQRRLAYLGGLVQQAFRDPKGFGSVYQCLPASDNSVLEKILTATLVKQVEDTFQIIGRNTYGLRLAGQDFYITKDAYGNLTLEREVRNKRETLLTFTPNNDGSYSMSMRYHGALFFHDSRSRWLNVGEFLSAVNCQLSHANRLMVKQVPSATKRAELAESVTSLALCSLLSRGQLDALGADFLQRFGIKLDDGNQHSSDKTDNLTISDNGGHQQMSLNNVSSSLVPDKSKDESSVVSAGKEQQGIEDGTSTDVIENTPILKDENLLLSNGFSSSEFEDGSIMLADDDFVSVRSRSTHKDEEDYDPADFF